MYRKHLVTLTKDDTFKKNRRVIPTYKICITPASLPLFIYDATSPQCSYHYLAVSSLFFFSKCMVKLVCLES